MLSVGITYSSFVRHTSSNYSSTVTKHKHPIIIMLELQVAESYKIVRTVQRFSANLCFQRTETVSSSTIQSLNVLNRFCFTFEAISFYILVRCLIFPSSSSFIDFMWYWSTESWCILLCTLIIWKTMGHTKKGQTKCDQKTLFLHSKHNWYFYTEKKSGLKILIKKQYIS